MREVYPEEMFFNEVETVKEVLDFVKTKFKENDVSFEMQCGAICMLFDELFEENSVEVAEDCLNKIRIVNAELGHWDEKKQMSVKDPCYANEDILEFFDFAD